MAINLCLIFILLKIEYNCKHEREKSKDSVQLLGETFLYFGFFHQKEMFFSYASTVEKLIQIQNTPFKDGTFDFRFNSCIEDYGVD